MVRSGLSTIATKFCKELAKEILSSNIAGDILYKFGQSPTESVTATEHIGIDILTCVYHLPRRLTSNLGTTSF